MDSFIVRWTDLNGYKKSKEYTDEKLAKKARDWLTDNGIKDADIAVKLVLQTTE